VNLGHYLRFLDRSLLELGGAFSEVAEAHSDEPDVRDQCKKFARTTMRQRELLDTFLEQYKPDDTSEDDAHRLFGGTREGPLGLLRDVHDLWLMTCDGELRWTLIQQAAQGTRDADLIKVAKVCRSDTALQMSWLRSRMKQGAAQALIVAD